MTPAEIDARFICLDCSGDTAEMAEYYMVHDHVWMLTLLGKEDGMRCIGCLETRIGRRLTRDDFTDVPVNKLNRRHSERMRERLR